jgi:hypothetical protein
MALLRLYARRVRNGPLGHPWAIANGACVALVEEETEWSFTAWVACLTRARGAA